MIKKIINITLLVVLFLLPLTIFPPGYFPDTYNTPKMYLLYGCGITLLICLLIDYKKLKFHKTDILLLAFILLICISTIFSVNVKESIFGCINRNEGLLTFICYYLIYYCAKYYFEFNNKVKVLSLIVIMITSLLAILQYYNISPIYEIFSKNYGDSFAGSTFGNRNFYGSFVSIAVPYTMCLYIFYKKKIYLFISSITFFGLLVSLTRSSWIAFFIISIIGIIYILKLKDKKIILRALILLACFILMFILFYFSNPKNFTTKYNSTVNDINKLTTSSKLPIVEKQNNVSKIGSGRLTIWKGAIKIIVDHPIIGCGPDAFLTELCTNHLEFLINDLQPTIKGFPDKVHNEYLQIAATSGIPALIIYLSFIFITLKKLFNINLKQNKEAFIMLLCLTSYLIQAFFNISTISIAPIFYFLLGYSHKLKHIIRLNEKN